MKLDPTSDCRRPPGSFFAGVLIGLIAVSNLAQGAWSSVFSLNLTVVALPLLAVLALLSPKRSRRGSLTFVVLFVVGVGLGFSPPSLNSYSEDLRTQIVITVVAPIILVSLAPSRWKFYNSFVATVIVLAVIVAILQFAHPSLEGGSMLRRTPEGVNPINSGRLLAAGAICCLVALRWVKAARWRMVLTPLGLVLLGCSALTGSRGSFFAAIVVGSLIILFTRSLSPVLRMLCWSAVAAPVYLLLSGGLEGETRLSSTGDNGRADLLRGTWDVFTSNPMGIGWGNLSNFLQSGSVAAQGEAQYPHNILLEFAAEAGLVGLVMLVATLAAGYKGLRSWADSPEAQLFLALGGFAFICALTSTNIAGNRLLWVCLGVGLGAQMIARGGPQLSAEYRQARSAKIK